ncbi:helix-turn-helix domain-containing protein [Streptomyces sp. NPDC058289]|uniref:helix-turn-helix domain-containing protein n=1 Tax=Streptomyces sp. NPDC058289 TaxID=3346425 RepID=UPI0036EB9150
MRFATLAALCDVLDCQPGDLLRWESGDGVRDAAARDGCGVVRSEQGGRGA